MPPAASVPNTGRRLRLTALAAATIPLSAWLACATPFPALATLAALHLGRRGTLAALALAWGLNQTIGFGLLGYPQDPATFGWGAAIGAAALAAAGAAGLATRLPIRSEPLRAGLALLAAFAAYECGLAAAAWILPSGPDAYGPAVVARLFLVNAATLAGLVLADMLGRLLAAGTVRTRAA